MKLEMWVNGKSENGYGEEGILLKGARERVLSVVKTKHGLQFMEECDGAFSITLTKEEALIAIDELKEWINHTN